MQPFAYFKYRYYEKWLMGIAQFFVDQGYITAAELDTRTAFYAAQPDAPLPEGVEAQTRRVFDNLRLVLAGVGLGLEHVVMARIYLSEFRRDYAALNRIWPEFWAPGKLPARTTVGVTALAVDALVEIDLVARRP